MTAAAWLRATLGAPGILAAPGVGDALGARLVDRAGFSAVYLGGNALGVTLAKGQPLLDLTETAEAAARIVRTTDLPLIVDAGAGFGDVPHVHRTVREIEAAGAAALHIDDQPFPKSASYHRGSGGLAPAEEAAARIAVACRARRSPEFMVLARTDAFRVTGSIEETIDRCRAYVLAGADGLVLLDVEDAKDVSRVAAAVPEKPLAWIGGVVPPVLPLAELGARGFSLALYPFNAVAASVVAMADLLATLNETGQIAQEDATITRMRRELSLIAGLDTYWEIEDALRSGTLGAPLHAEDRP